VRSNKRESGSASQAAPRLVQSQLRAAQAEYQCGQQAEYPCYSRVSRAGQDGRPGDSSHQTSVAPKPPMPPRLTSSTQQVAGWQRGRRRGGGGARTGLEAEFEDSEAIDRARPKSHTLTRQSEFRSMFEGFMSRCSIPAVCMYLSALSSWYMIYCLCTCQRKAVTSGLSDNQ